MDLDVFQQDKPKEEESPVKKSPTKAALQGDASPKRPTTINYQKRKIDKLRKFHGSLIDANQNHMEFINNCFVSAGRDTAISLSVYLQGDSKEPRLPPIEKDVKKDAGALTRDLDTSFRQE